MFLFSSFVRIYALILMATLLFQAGDKMASYRMSQQAEAFSESQPVSLVIWTDRLTYSLRDTLELKALLQNDGNETTYVDRRLLWMGLAGGLKLTIMEEHGKYLPSKLLSDSFMPPPDIGDLTILIALEPGMLYGTSLSLAVKGFFPKPGRYALQVAYGSWLHKETVAPQLRNLPAIWKGLPIIQSKTVWITVTATSRSVRH